jgi:hypothetical protein
VASTVFAFVQAKAATDNKKDAEDARNEARAARDESSGLAREANASFGRQADALERANQLLGGCCAEAEVASQVKVARAAKESEAGRAALDLGWCLASLPSALG